MKQNLAHPGWYGKLPALGDFAKRRLPFEFIQVWDRWLRESILTSQLDLKINWQERFFASPCWNFLLTPGVIGNSFWTGVLVPSVDRVGRAFPLTIAISDVLLQDFTWFKRAEDVAQSAIMKQESLDYFDMQVLALGTPGVINNFNILNLNIKQQSLDPSESIIWETCDVQARLNSYHFASGVSIWWSSRSQQLGLSQGLPHPEHFRMFL